MNIIIWNVIRLQVFLSPVQEVPVKYSPSWRLVIAHMVAATIVRGLRLLRRASYNI